jgi:hypothetical protein
MAARHARLGASSKAPPRRAAAARRPTAAAAAPPPPPPPLALKEWAPAVAALLDGSQTVLLRKGGVREPAFSPTAGAFLLFPTAFHSDAALLKPAAQARYAANAAADPRAEPGLSLRCFARVTGAWTTADAGVLAALDPLHPYTEDWLAARLRWRAATPLTVLEVRAYALAEPVEVVNEEALWGCFSWVELPGVSAEALAAAAARARPALDDAAFAAQQALCRARLAGLPDARELEY